MQLPSALVQAQLAIHMYTLNPSAVSLVHLHRTLQTAMELLPPVHSIPNEIPEERISSTPKFYGEAWKSVDLDRFYKRIFQTCHTAQEAQRVLVRLQTTSYVFTEVLLGRVLYPLQIYFETFFGSFEDAYTHVVERVFLYFVANEGKTYNAEDAFRNVHIVARKEDYIYLISVLEQYDPTRFRTSSHRGVIHFMFSPSSTRSVRDLSRDYFIERFRAVKLAATKKVVQTQAPVDVASRASEMNRKFPAVPSTPSTPGTFVFGSAEDAVPDVVRGVFSSVFG